MSNSVRNTISVRDNRESITHFMLLICNILGVYLLVILKKNRTSLKLLNYCYTDIVRENICDDFLTIHMKILIMRISNSTFLHSCMLVCSTF